MLKSTRTVICIDGFYFLVSLVPFEKPNLNVCRKYTLQHTVLMQQVHFCILNAHTHTHEPISI